MKPRWAWLEWNRYGRIGGQPVEEQEDFPFPVEELEGFPEIREWSSW